MPASAQCPQCSRFARVDDLAVNIHCKSCTKPFNVWLEPVNEAAPPKSPAWSALIVVGVFFLTLFVPWRLARHDNVETETQLKALVQKKVCAQDGSQERSSDELLRQALGKQRLRSVKPSGAVPRRGTENRLMRFCRTGDASSEPQAKTSSSDAENEPSKSKSASDSSPEIYFLPFFPGEATMTWPLGMSVLCLLLYWYWPTHLRGTRCQVWSHWCGFAVFMSIMNLAANVLPRTLALAYSDGRRVYSYASLDLATASGCWALGLFVFQAIILAGIWTRYILDVAFLEELGPDTEQKAVATALSERYTIALSEEFAKWQRVSVLLVCGFLPGAFAFWRVVSKMHDNRYLLGAAVYHGIYAITWYVVSRPFAHRWKHWHNTRLRALGAVAQRAQTDPTAKDVLASLVSALDKLQPVPHNSLVVAAFGALIAVLAPFYQVFAK